MKFIRTFDELKKDDISIAGGKGANLGELISFGMPVPPGFVITTSAYEKILKDNRLEASIAGELKKSQDGVAIREMFIRARIPQEIEQEIESAFRGLGADALAVRSSATAEDLPGAAFAGQQDTYLNIDQEGIVDAVKKVWSSLWSERAIAYRERLGVDHRTVKIAVVVQQMVEAEVAGVLFTANVITGARDEVVVDASLGLGEAVVSGEVIPDHFVLKKKFFGWHFAERKRGERASNLSNRTLRELARLGKTIERHFGAPQDIEWARADGKIFIVQSRPITALIADLPKLGMLSRMFSSIVAEVMPRRPYPLERLLVDLIVRDFLQRAFRVVGFKITNPKKLLPEEGGVATHFTGRLRIRPTIFILLAPFRFLYYALRYNPTQWKEDPLIEKAINHIKELESKNYSELSPKELVALVPSSLQMFEAMITVRLRYLPRIVLAILGVRIWLTLKGRNNLFATLLFAGVSTKVTKTNAELEKLAKKMGSGEEFEVEFQEFLDEYGYRESAGTMLIAEPSWKDNPDAVLEIMKSMTATPPKVAKTDWRKLHDEVSQSGLFKKLLDIARLTHEIREDTRFYIMMSIRVIRLAVLEFGDRLKRERIIDSTGEVFYFKFEELEKIAEDFPSDTEEVSWLRSLVASRKKKYTELSVVSFVDPRIYQRKISGMGVLASGTAGSPGVAEGPARIVRNSSEFKKLRPSDILVAPYTNPSWTPLFERAAGVVVDTGSVVSHAAIVAREYGIPAVMGTVEGTTKLKDGMMVRVDGAKGAVFRVNRRAEEA